MLESPAETLRVATAEQPGLSPSACSCEEKKEEPNAAVHQHAAAGVSLIKALEPSPSIQPSAVSPAKAGTMDGLYQQACSCGGGQPPQIVYALGALWFDFGTEARYDAIVQQMGGPLQANNPAELFAFLRDNPQFNAGITYILMQDQIPLYAVQPAGPFAQQTYDAILDAVTSSLDEVAGREQRVSLPGYVSGSTRLMNGMTVPVVFPDLRGMYKWQSGDLIQATRSVPAGKADSDDAILNFLNRVYYELRNFGIAPQERAMNYAATNAYQARQAFADSAAHNLELDSIRVVKSPICRPDSDCWDVQLVMFDPDNERRANRVYRFTVDVSEVLPVTVGTVRTWAARA
jgi:cyanobactin maturation PatA/PatG family protease